MKKHLIAVLLLLMVGGTAFAQLGVAADKPAKKTDLTAKVPIDRKVKIGHLDNGLTYYVRNNKKPENRIQFRMVTNAGSILEDESQRGLAHFCEHMAFNGTKPYPHNSMIDQLQKNGIEFGRGINAWTSFDETVYYVDMPADNPDMVQMGFNILDGWMGKLLFDPQELEDERGVIHEEWRGNLGAMERMRNKTFPILLKGSLYAERLPIGLESVIMGFKRDDIVRFYNDWYRPDLQAVVIVGDFAAAGMTDDDVIARIKEVYGQTPKRDNVKPRPSFDIPGNKEPLIAIATDKEATSAQLNFFWKHPKAPQGTVGDYRQSLVRSLINSMLGDRFNELSEKATAPMMMAYASYSGFLGRSCDAFSVAAAPKENQIEATMELLLTELRRIDQHGFLQAELDRQKEDLLSWYTKSAKEENKTQSNSLAQEYTNNFLEGEVIPGIKQEWRYAKEFLPGITLQEVNDMVASWITDDNFVVWLMAPEKEGFRVPNEQQILDIYNRTKNVSTTPWVDTFKDEPLFDKELAAVTPKVTKTNKALDYTEYTCPNGIRFIVKKTELKADEIHLRSFAFGGSSLYEDKDAFAAEMATSLIDDAGIAQFNKTQLQKKLKGVNGYVSPSLSDLTQGFEGSFSPKDLETMLQLLYLYYDAPRKDQESFDKNIDNLRNQIKFIAENPQVAFALKFHQVSYPNDKRSVLIPTDAQISALTLDQVYNIFRERFCDASAQTFFFVGNVSDEDISLIARYLGNLPCNKKQAKEMWKDRSSAFAKGLQRATVNKGTDNQGILCMVGVTEGFNPTPENRMIVEQLGEAIQITALEIIREKMGGTYSPSAGTDYEILPKPEFNWNFRINCDPDKAETIEQAVIDILKGYINNGPADSTLAKVQEQMIINRESSMQNNGYWMGQIYGSYYYGENRDGNASLDDYAKRVKAVKASDIQKMAKKFINLKNYVVVMLKPEAKAE